MHCKSKVIILLGCTQITSGKENVIMRVNDDYKFRTLMFACGRKEAIDKDPPSGLNDNYLHLSSSLTVVFC